VLPLPPILLDEGTALQWNKAVHLVVQRHIQPEFRRLIEVSGHEMDLEGDDISRVLSAPGTYRPTNPKKADAVSLQGGYLRRWLSPYIGTCYPKRQECSVLAALVREMYRESCRPKEVPRNWRAPVMASLYEDSDAKRAWLNDYAWQKEQPDHSSMFQALVGGVFYKYGENAVWDLKYQIHDLCGGKYEGRLDQEIERSLSKVTTP
jgi:hypothetical protein